MTLTRRAHKLEKMGAPRHMHPRDKTNPLVSQPEEGGPGGVPSGGG